MRRVRPLGVTANADGTFDLPDNMPVVGALFDPTTGLLNVVVLQDIQIGEAPADAAAQADSTKVIELKGPPHD